MPKSDVFFEDFCIILNTVNLSKIKSDPDQVIRAKSADFFYQFWNLKDGINYMISFKETHANLFWSVISCINEFLSYRNSSENSATRSCICKANEHQISLKTYEFRDPNTARRARHPKHHPNSLPKPSTITFSNCEAGDTPESLMSAPPIPSFCALFSRYFPMERMETIQRIETWQEQKAELKNSSISQSYDRNKIYFIFLFNFWNKICAYMLDLKRANEASTTQNRSSQIINFSRFLRRFSGS